MSSIGKTAGFVLVDTEGKQGAKNRPGFKARAEQRAADRKRMIEAAKERIRAREGGQANG